MSDPPTGAGPVFQFFAADHRRLDALLARAAVDPARVELEPFGEFRAGILKHIAMEEKRLIPALTVARGGEPFPLAAKLRVDHGAIAALLVPAPRHDIVVHLQSVLAPHNAREEAPDGLYRTCDRLFGEASAARLIDDLRSFPDIRLKPYNDGPAVERHIRETLELSRRQWSHETGVELP